MENLMDRICSTTVKMINADNTPTNSLKGGHLGDKDVNVRIILKGIFKM
jgi:hypothetical protein